MEYWGVSAREGLEYLIERYPDSVLSVNVIHDKWDTNIPILSKPHRDRILLADIDKADFYIYFYRGYGSRGKEDFDFLRRVQEIFLAPIYTREVYNNTIMMVFAKNRSLAEAATIDTRLHKYRPVEFSRAEAGPNFEIYLDGKNLIYFKETCVPADTRANFFLHIIPNKLDDLPGSRLPHGYANYGFTFDQHGVNFGGQCAAIVPLPDYPVDYIRTGQWSTNKWKFWEDNPRIWEIELYVGR